MNVNAALTPAPNPVLPIYMVQDRKLYRKRPETFLEPVTWPSRPPAPYEDEADVPLVDPPLYTFLRSKQTSVHASITFNNKSGVDCRLLWINFQGEEVAYTVITKGEVKTYSTFFNHLWIARDARTGARLLIEGAGAVVGRAKHYEALITEPGPLPYSEERFRLWPEAAKAQIRTLLLCHHRLRYRPALDALGQDPHPEASGATGPKLNLMGMITGIPKAICGLARGAAGWNHRGPPSGPVKDSDGSGASRSHAPQCSPFQPLKTGLVVLPSPMSPAGAAPISGAVLNDSILSLFFTPTDLDDGHHVEGAAAVAALHEAGAGLTLRFSTPSRAAAAAVPVPATLAPLSSVVKSSPQSPWAAGAAGAAAPMECDADLSDPSASSDAEPDLDLGSLPEHLVVEWIIPRALAPLRQNPDLGALVAPDVGPVLLPSDPEPADAELAAGPAAVVPNSPQGGNHAQPLPANALDVAFAGLNWDVPE